MKQLAVQLRSVPDGEVLAEYTHAAAVGKEWQALAAELRANATADAELVVLFKVGGSSVPKCIWDTKAIAMHAWVDEWDGGGKSGADRWVVLGVQSARRIPAGGLFHLAPCPATQTLWPPHLLPSPPSPLFTGSRHPGPEQRVPDPPGQPDDP